MGVDPDLLGPCTRAAPLPTAAQLPVAVDTGLLSRCHSPDLRVLSLAASRLAQRSVPVAFLGDVAGGTRCCTATQMMAQAASPAAMAGTRAMPAGSTRPPTSPPIAAPA